nr:putative odorant receptor 92a [Maniola hyperantus]
MAQPINFDKSLQKLQFIFRCSGLTFESKKLTKTHKLKKRCVYLLNFFWLNSDLIGGIYWFIDGIRTGKTFVELTYIAPCVTFSFLADLKAMFMIHYEDYVCNLIDQLRELEIKHETVDEKKYIKFLHLILKCSDILSLVLMLMFITNPIILISLKYYQTKEVDLVLPFLILYPFDSHDIRYWPFVYIHQFWSGSIVLLNICGADNLLYVCCTYLGVQFRLLQHDIENLIEKNYVSMYRESEEFQQKFVKLVKWHKELIRLSSMLEFIYAESTLINFVSSSVMICLTGFNVIAMENVAFVVTFLVFLSASLMQIFMLCFFGDFLMKSSMEVSHAVYNSKWYHLNVTSGKNLLIVLTRAQKPCKLTAFGFSDVSLKAFMSILSSAWSYFALLKTVYSPPKN